MNVAHGRAAPEQPPHGSSTESRLIAHRLGAGWGPENSLQAFSAARRAGLRAFECDVKLSSDGVAFLLHDDDLARTAGLAGRGSALPWRALRRWQPSLQDLADACAGDAIELNLEIKPDSDACCALQADWGARIAAAAARLWADAPRAPLLSSFSPAALQGAALAAPRLPRAWLCCALPPNWRGTAQALGVEGIHLDARCAGTDQIDAAHAQRLRVRLYTVNDGEQAASWLAAGVDALFTDCLAGVPSPVSEKSPR